MRFQNRKQKKELENKVMQNWGAKISVSEVVQNNKGKLWIVSKDVAKIRLDRVRIESIGMYFGRYDKRGDLRLSVDGSMIVGPLATKNVEEISMDETEKWVRGLDLYKKTGKQAYVILKNGDDYVGCGKAYSKGILNHVPKERIR